MSTSTLLSTSTVVATGFSFSPPSAPTSPTDYLLPTISQQRRLLRPSPQIVPIRPRVPLILVLGLLIHPRCLLQAMYSIRLLIPQRLCIHQHRGECSSCCAPSLGDERFLCALFVNEQTSPHVSSPCLIQKSLYPQLFLGVDWVLTR